MNLLLQAFCLGMILLSVVALVITALLGIIHWNDQFVIRIYTRPADVFKRIPGGYILSILLGVLFWVCLVTLIMWITLSIYNFF